MAKGGRVVLGAVFVVIILVTILFLSHRLLTKSLPQTSGTLQLSILQSPVHVYRDQYGVPHIFADNERDLFKAAGYVTAQDRLWQMDFNRRIAAGRLAEIFGETAVESDIFIRTWGFERTARQIVNSLSAESRQVVEDYAAGVNAFIDTHRDRLPIEFTLLKYQPEKWKIEDSVAFVRLMGWRLSFGWYVDLALNELVAKLGEAKAREAFPDFPKEGPFIVQPSAVSLSAQVEDFLNAGLALREFLGMHDAQLGSNSWVVAGAKSECGKPLLANDPHLELTAPSIWYEMHLVGGKFNVIGVAFAGAPGIIIGHNENIAWGLTNGMVDDVDFFIENVNPENSNQYWDGRQWVEFQQVEEEILVKDGEPVRLKIPMSQNGPIISSIHPLLKDKKEAVALRWTGHQPSDELAAFLKIQKAKDWPQFLEGVRHFKVPAQNFIFASHRGDIGYHLAGAVPIRKQATGILPHAGGTDIGQWIDEVPFEKLPQVFNPTEQYIVTANNKIVDDHYPYYITNLWEPPSRAERIHQVLSQKAKLSVADFQSLQVDVLSSYAQKWLPLLLTTLKAELDSNSRVNDELRTLYDLMKEWDGREHPESLAASIFNAFFVQLIENTFKDEMGEELYRSYIHLGNVPARVIMALVAKGQSEWFDNITTPEMETREDMIVRSLRDAGSMLRNLGGAAISDWAWGKLHTITMSHPLGRRRPLDIIFNLGPFPRGGSKMTVNNSEYRLSSPFAAFLGASTRQIVDFCDLNKSLSVITTGQSGQCMSPHYRDQIPLWLEGKYHPSVMDMAVINRSSAEHLLLTP